VIPWWFITEAAKELNFVLPPVIYIGIPPHPDAGDESLIPELVKLGHNISSLIAELNSRRIAIVVSSDLSHYHSNASTSPYPWDPSAVPFDNYISDWAKLNYTTGTEPEAAEIIRKKAGELVNSVGTCGYRGLVMLHGMLQKAVEEGSSFHSHFLEYSAPTYFGMMVNYWLPIPTV
jgi:AmmeMemoRadiSam system protein B